jgi:predicted regulator of amino acid metabolism with ACT domain
MKKKIIELLENIISIKDLLIYPDDTKIEHADEARAVGAMMRKVESLYKELTQPSEKITQIIKEVADQYPYKKIGDRDSYLPYNEGWSDACDVIEQRLIEEQTLNKQRMIQETQKPQLNISDVSKRFDKVHVVIEAKSEDYHGTYNEIVQIFANREDADKKVIELSGNNYKGNVEYFIDTWNVD